MFASRTLFRLVSHTFNLIQTKIITRKYAKEDGKPKCFQDNFKTMPHLHHQYFVADTFIKVHFVKVCNRLENV